MARDTQQPTLSQGNLIYLYQLLSRTIGCGKQTFITRVEEALDSDRMSAYELGFASTRDLLEALDAFVTLTVFKGGRIYATVAAQPAWDEALAAAEKGEKATGASSAKPWKRKKGNRALKPIKPKRVKRDPEPTAEAAATDGDDTAITAADADTNGAATATLPAAPETAPAISLTVTYDPYSGIDEETPLVASGTSPQAPTRSNADAGAAVDVSAHEPAAPEQEQTSSPAPAARLSARSAQPANAVQNGIPADAQSETADNQQKPGTTSGPQEPDGAAASRNAHATATPPDAGAAAPLDARDAASVRDPQVAPTSQNASTDTNQNLRSNHPAPTEAALRSWPNSFSCDVYCPGEQVAALGALLPFGCDPHALLAADYQRARDLDLAWGTRGRVTFPLRIEHGDRTAPIEVTLQKRSGAGLPWGLTDVS